MKTISLNTTRTYQKNQTSKYWRDVECGPQTVELKSWSSNHPLFILSGKIVRSHDQKEIGQTIDVYVQTYSFWLEPQIEKGIYSVKQ